MDSTLSLILVVLAILGVISFIFRELACWYWKINESLGVLKEIRAQAIEQNKVSLGVLKEIRDLLVEQKSELVAPEKPPQPA